MEDQVRRRVLDYANWAHSRGRTLAEISSACGLASATLSRWIAKEEEGTHARDGNRARTRGRPPGHLDRHARQEVLLALILGGPNLPVETLKSIRPEASRRALDHLRHRYRQVWRWRQRRLQRTLEWTESGRVWAADFSEPPHPIEGRFPYLFIVRDLASGEQLLALPVDDVTTTTACRAMERLFRELGAPLVLKVDNGSAFVAEAFRKLLKDHHVTTLYSPPGLPQFNGSVEAGIGGLKTRAHHAAIAAGRPFEWTCDDIEQARCESNLHGRPRGKAGTTPSEAWDNRRPIQREERDWFGVALAIRRLQEYASRGACNGVLLDDREKAGADRVATARALQDCGLLAIGGRRVSLPLSELRAR